MTLYFPLASGYGDGKYGCTAYSAASSVPPECNDLVQIGPLTLPVTGSTLLSLVGALLIAVGVGLGVWVYQRRKKQHA